MPKRALIERRPWLLASLAFGISYWFISQSHMPGLYQIAWKGAGVALLGVYAWLHHPWRGAHMIAAVMALGALGDMILEIDFSIGAIAFMAGHLTAIALYLQHRRAAPSPSQKALAVTLLVFVPALAWLFTKSGPVLLYSVSLAGMAAAAWLSNFPRYRTGLGALMFAVSDLLIFARMGPLAGNALAGMLVWPLYYLGQFLICTSVISTLRQRVSPLRAI